MLIFLYREHTAQCQTLQFKYELFKCLLLLEGVGKHQDIQHYPLGIGARNKRKNMARLSLMSKI